METLIILLSILCVISVIVGIWSFKKYRETKDNKFLVLGILFTFVILEVLIVIIFRLYRESTVIMCYEAIPANLAGMVVGRKEFVEKFKSKLPRDIYDRVSKENKII